MHADRGWIKGRRGFVCVCVWLQIVSEGRKNRWKRDGYEGSKRAVRRREGLKSRM